MELISTWLFFATPSVHASGFLVARGTAAHSTTATPPAGSIERLQGEVRGAVGAALGCGGEIGYRPLVEIRRVLKPMWHALPKRRRDRIEQRAFRYLVHRYFRQQYSMVVRGYEEARPGDMSSPNGTVAAVLEDALDLDNVGPNGLALEDVVQAVAALEQLMFHSESRLLEAVFIEQNKSLTDMHSYDAVSEVIREYLLRWMMGNDPTGIQAFTENRTLFETFPYWGDLVSLAEGQVKSLEYARLQAPAGKGRRPARGRALLTSTYSFEDAHEAVGDIAKTFAGYWASDCADMKAQLVSMDRWGSGRVRLADFYAAGLRSEWRFGEGEAYLRDLGALDETSPWLGTQVIIPNYIQAASNCIVSTPHYLACCSNACEDLMGEIEVALGSPVATVGEILPVIGNVSLAEGDSAGDGAEEPMRLSGPIVRQLESIGRKHGGMIPIHGRLFAQWLHFVFPRDCPFPHRAGDASVLTPTEFGKHYIVSDQEMQRHAAKDVPARPPVPEGAEGSASEDIYRMSQWTPHEELIATYDDHFGQPWWLNILECCEGHLHLVVALALFSLIAIGSVLVTEAGFFGDGTSFDTLQLGSSGHFCGSQVWTAAKTKVHQT